MWIFFFFLKNKITLHLDNNQKPIHTNFMFKMHDLNESKMDGLMILIKIFSLIMINVFIVVMKLVFVYFVILWVLNLFYWRLMYYFVSFSYNYVCYLYCLLSFIIVIHVFLWILLHRIYHPSNYELNILY